MRVASLLPWLVGAAIVLQSCTMVNAHKCSGGRKKITPLVRTPGFGAPAGCSVPGGSAIPVPLSLTTELGIAIPVLYSSGSGGAAFSLPGIGLGAWSISNAAFSAAVVYTDTGKPTIPHGIPRAPVLARTLLNRNTAVLFAVLGLSRYYNPATPLIATVAGLGLDPNIVCPAVLTDLSVAACVGLKSAEKMIKLVEADKYNYGGCIGRQYNCQKFNDWVGFEPSNTAYTLTYRNRWQPLVEHDGNGVYFVQTHIGANVAKVEPFVFTKKDIEKRKIAYKEPTWAEYVNQTNEMIRASQSLKHDENKIRAEFFNGGAFAPLSYYPVEKGWDLMKALSFYQMFSIYHDLLIVTIGEKIRHNTVRPQSAIRYVYGDRKITAWAGRGQGIQRICGNEWVPYLPTAPEGEYPSGQVCFCTMFGEWMEKFLGTKKLNYTVTVKKGCSVAEPGLTPKKDTYFKIPTTDDFRTMCARGRVLGGMHFPPATQASQKLCKGMGYAGFDWIKKYWSNL